MIDLRQLDQLIVIAEEGTISKAAEKLNISQPALSRAMQKLEEDLNVSLFDHHKNKIILNNTGQLLVKRARALLKEVHKTIEDVTAFDKAHRSVSIACCTPAPIWDLKPLLKQLHPDIEITSKVVGVDELVELLLSKQYSMVITPFEVNDSTIISVPYIEEDLALSVPNHHPLATKEEVSYEDLANETMILYSNIGFWYDMHKRDMPTTKFIIQPDRNAFKEIVKASTFPSFTSNLSIKREGTTDNRVVIPLYNQLLNVIDTYYDY